MDSALNNLPEFSMVFIDTNEVITAIKYPEFNEKVLGYMKGLGYTFVALPEVLLEFVRGSDTREQYNIREIFITDLVDSNYPSVSIIEKELIPHRLVLHRLCQGMGYVDLLLGVSLCKYPNAYMLTQNHKHFPLTVFERVGVVTTDVGADIANHALYKINSTKMIELLKQLG